MKTVPKPEVSCLLRNGLLIVGLARGDGDPDGEPRSPIRDKKAFDMVDSVRHELSQNR